ncbi:MAG: Fe-S cluster assembly protein SufD [Sphingomonadales bacterium]
METGTLNKLSLFVEDLIESDLSPKALKDAAHEFLAGQDFPTTRSERFKYTRLAKLANATFTQPETIDTTQVEEAKVLTDAYTIVVNHENITLPQNLPAGVAISLISATQIPFQSASFKDVFGALNVLYAQHGISINIAPNTTLDKPIQLIQINSGGKFFYRYHLNFGRNSEASLYVVSKQQAHINGFSHTHFQYEIAQDARIKIFKIQDTSLNHFDFNEDRGVQAAQSHFEINTITLNGSFVRNDAQVMIQGEHAQTYLNGAYWLKEEQHVANYTTIDHQVANCESFETYKGVAADKASAVFNGKVFVRKDAQKTNAYQSNANVLLSENASINSKPELEIYADDVKCSHGSTTGQLDENALFYLRARGLSEAAAKNLLLQAFMEDVLQYLKNEEVLAYVHNRIAERFNWNY